MSKAIVMKGCKNGVVSNNIIVGNFDVGIEIDNCENIETFGNKINISAPPTPQNKPVKTHKVGRNEKCPCGSGKKYKKCCGG